MKDTRRFLECIIKVHKYKLKGDETLCFHLSCEFSHNPNMTEFQPKRGGLSLTLMDQGQPNNPKFIS